MSFMVYRLTTSDIANVISPEHFIQTDQPLKSLISTDDANTQLFWNADVRHSAEWDRALQNLFPGIPRFEVELPTAVIITKVDTINGSAWYAISYGHGHALIDNSKIVRRWGLKVVLNLICEDANVREALRRVDSRTIRANSLSIAKQVSRPDSIDSFGFNTQTDVLRAISGQPSNNEWGSSVYGHDGVKVPLGETLIEIHQLLAELEEIHDRQDYSQRFGWVDRIYPVRDIALRTVLHNELINQLRSKNVENLALTTPDFADWENSNFRIKGVGSQFPQSDLTLLIYLNALEQRSAQSSGGVANLNALQVLSVDRLKQHRLVNESTGESWPLFRCIEGEIMYDGKIYPFLEGEFYELDIDFANEVDTYLNARLTPSKRTFPDNQAKLAEEDYIENIAQNHLDLIVMDQELVQGYPTTADRVGNHPLK